MSVWTLVNLNTGEQVWGGGVYKSEYVLRVFKGSSEGGVNAAVHINDYAYLVLQIYHYYMYVYTCI